MTDVPTTAHSAARNPQPRPALQRRADDDTVIAARPRAGTAPATADSLAPISADSPEDDGGQQKRAKDKVTAGRDERAGKDGKKRKDGRKPKAGKHSKGKDRHDGPGAEVPAGRDTRDDRELTIVLPKAVRRALTEAAVEHGTTPERLAALVLNEWLDH